MTATAVGDLVFFRHPVHSWVLGHVESSDGGVICSCRADDRQRAVVGEVIGKLRLEIDVTPALVTVINENVNDLLQLTVLHESTLLRCLHARYMSDVIYTNVGAIVVALNPFTFQIPHYQDSEMQKYLSAPPEGSDSLLPHTWATAHATFHELLSSRQSQFILVSGESGSGKTEASKIVVKYLTAVSKGRGSGSEAALVGERMQQCSPFLECFGNAKTVRNDNSSRFGKFMKIRFALPSGALLGCATERYLLEKSRVVVAAAGERVYHSFYLLFRGVADRVGIRLPAASTFTSLNSGGVVHNEDYDTAEDAEAVLAAMKFVGLSEESIRSAWRLAAGILHLLNVRFEANADGLGCEPTGASTAYLDGAAALWAVRADALRSELIQTKLVVRGETSFKQHSMVLAYDCRDAVCKALYDSLFLWLVEQANCLCDYHGTTHAAEGWIGLLDIFGFEDFKTNSFEQLCINLANETLQGHYNQFVFERDIEECQQEGIDTVHMTCPDNRPCLDLIGGASPKSILALLDDQSAMASGSNLTFVETCVAAHGGGKSADFVTELTRRDGFSVRHYAGQVRYDCNGWVEKNRDTLKDGMREALVESSDAVIGSLLRPRSSTSDDGAAPPAVRSSSTKRAFVSTTFRLQLSHLMTVITSSNPHWIRCIKPHPAKKPRMFDGIQALAQLESSGVLGTVKIRKAGYPVRILYRTFAERFLPLSREAAVGKKKIATKGDRERALQDADWCRQVTRAILSALEMTQHEVSQMGKTKLFLKADALTKLEHARRDYFEKSYSRIRRVGRAFLCRKRTAFLLLESAVQRIVVEYRDYCRRSAALRAERAQHQTRLLQERAAASSALEADFVRAVEADWLEFLRQRVVTLTPFLIALESWIRAALTRSEETTWKEFRDSLVYAFLIGEEAFSRKMLCETGPMAMERYYLLHAALDTLMDDVVEEEDYCRRLMTVEALQWFDIKRNRALFRETVAIVAHLGIVLMSHLWNEQHSEWRSTILEPHFAALASKVAAEEEQQRLVVAQSERVERDSVAEVRRQARFCVRVEMLVNHEARERCALERVEEVTAQRTLWEPHERGAARWTVTLLEMAEARNRASILALHDASHRAMSKLCADNRTQVEQLYVLLGEQRLRGAAQRHEAIARRLIYGDWIPPQAMLQRQRLIRSEVDWREQLLAAECSARSRVVQFVHRALYVLSLERALRRHIFLLHCLCHTELRNRHVVACHELRARDSLWILRRRLSQAASRDAIFRPTSAALSLWS